MEPHIWKIEWNDKLSLRIPEIYVDQKTVHFPVNGFNRSIVDWMELSEIKKNCSRSSTMPCSISLTRNAYLNSGNIRT
jgi:hypothetical protein